MPVTINKHRVVAKDAFGNSYSIDAITGNTINDCVQQIETARDQATGAIEQKLSDVGQNIVDSEEIAKMIAQEFSDTNYSIGDYVYKLNQTTNKNILYRFKSNHTAGSGWNSAQVEQITLATDLSKLIKKGNEETIDESTKILINNDEAEYSIPTYEEIRGYTSLLTNGMFPNDSAQNFQCFPRQITAKDIIMGTRNGTIENDGNDTRIKVKDLIFCSKGTKIVFTSPTLHVHIGWTSTLDQMTWDDPRFHPEWFFPSEQQQQKIIENDCYISIVFALSRDPIPPKMNTGMFDVNMVIYPNYKQVLQTIQHLPNLFKNVVCCGDSFTIGYMKINETPTTDYPDYSWPHYMSLLTGNNWINCGISGATVMSWQTDSDGLPKAKTYKNVSAYIISFLINDSSVDQSTNQIRVPLGNSSDINDPTKSTYYAQLANVVRQLHNTCPKAKIFINTYPHTYLEKYKQYNQAIRQVVEQLKSNTLSIHCIDLEKYKSMYDIIQQTKNFGDNHPTPVGQEQHAEIYNNILNKYMLNHIEEFRDVYLHRYNWLKDLKYKSDNHGVKELDLEYGLRLIWYTTNAGQQMLSRGNVWRSSYIYPMPSEGLSIYITDYAPFNIKFMYFENQEFIPATDYIYYNAALTRSINKLGYYPYKENLYFRIEYYYENINDIKQYLHIFTGKIKDAGGRLPNLQPAAIVGKKNDIIIPDGLPVSDSNAYRTEQENKKINQHLEYIAGWNWGNEKCRDQSNPNYEPNFASYWFNVMGAYGTCYCSVLPLQHVNKITVAPPYTMAARIYKVNNDIKEISIWDEIFGYVITKDYNSNLEYNAPHRGWIGVHTIDFSQYNTEEGFILLAIHAPINPATDTQTLTYQSMGMMHNYNDVYKSVYVDWMPGVSVSYDNNLPAIIRKNIDTITKYTTFYYNNIPKADSGYGNWVNENNVRMGITLGDCAGWWYNGSNTHNGPHMHVTPKSYITASKNLHSRVYVPTHPLKDTTNNNLYGTVCSSTGSLIRGNQVGTETFSVISELAEGMDFFDIQSIESFKPGDTFCAGNFDYFSDEQDYSAEYGHTVTITEVVSINGSVFSVNAIEGAQPWLRTRMYINDDQYQGYTCQTYYKGNYGEGNLLNSFSFSAYLRRPTVPIEHSWQKYNKIGRMKHNLLKTFIDAYGPYEKTDYSVTSIMCDRGTDSVYGQNQYMTLTVTDENINQIQVKRNNVTYNVNLNEYPLDVFDDARVFTVNGKYYKLYSFNFQTGTWTGNGTDWSKQDNDKQLRNKNFIPVQANTKITYKQTKSLQFHIQGTNESWTNTGDDATSHTCSNSGNLIITVSNINNPSAKMSPSNYDCNIKIQYENKNLITDVGYHQILVNNEVMESFYVAPNRKIRYVVNSFENPNTRKILTDVDWCVGYWSYNSPKANKHRIRSQELIKIQAGTTIKYKSPYRMYIGVLGNKTDGTSYLINESVGWHTMEENPHNYTQPERLIRENGMISYTINQDGYIYLILEDNTKDENYTMSHLDYNDQCYFEIIPPNGENLSLDDNNDLTIYFEKDDNDDKTICIAAFYDSEPEDKDVHRPIYHYLNIDSTTVETSGPYNGYCKHVIPYKETLADGLERTPYRIMDVRRTEKYGTYQVFSGTRSGIINHKILAGIVV